MWLYFKEGEKMKRKCIICLKEYEGYDLPKGNSSGRPRSMKKRKFGCPTCSKKCSLVLSYVKIYLSRTGWRKIE